MLAVLDDLRGADVDFVTIGQYLRPTPRHIAVARWVEPAEFDALRGRGRARRASCWWRSSPLTRSSYHADRISSGCAAPEPLRAAPSQGPRADAMADEIADSDPDETREWLDALDSVLAQRGSRARPLPDRAR